MCSTSLFIIAVALCAALCAGRKLRRLHRCMAWAPQHHALALVVGLGLTAIAKAINLGATPTVAMMDYGLTAAAIALLGLIAMTTAQALGYSPSTSVGLRAARAMDASVNDEIRRELSESETLFSEIRGRSTPDVDLPDDAPWLQTAHEEIVRDAPPEPNQHDPADTRDTAVDAEWREGSTASEEINSVVAGGAPAPSRNPADSDPGAIEQAHSVAQTIAQQRAEQQLTNEQQARKHAESQLHKQRQRLNELRTETSALKQLLDTARKDKAQAQRESARARHTAQRATKLARAAAATSAAARQHAERERRLHLLQTRKTQRAVSIAHRAIAALKASAEARH